MGVASTHAAPPAAPAPPPLRARHVLLLAGYEGHVQEWFFAPPRTLTPGRALAPAELGTRVSWLAFASAPAPAPAAPARARIVYTADEASPGRVWARRWDPDPAAPLLQPLRAGPSDVFGASSAGPGPVALALVGAAAAPGTDGPAGLVVANYDAGSAALLQLRRDGGIDAPPPPPSPAARADKHAHDSEGCTDSTRGASNHKHDDKHHDKDKHKDSRPDGVAVYAFRRADDAPIGPVSARQSAAYAHEAVTSPDGGLVYVPDLGTDTVHVLKVQTHRLGGRPHVTAKLGHDTECPPGSGPRHIAFFPPGLSTVGGRFGAHGPPPAAAAAATAPPKAQHAYLAQELNCTLQAFSVGSSGALAPLGPPVLAVPPGLELGGTPTAGPQRTTSEVVVSPDGRFVYVGTRGDPVEDHISIFTRHPDGTATFKEWVPSGGQMPRHFSISLDADAEFLAVANQASSRCTLFARDPRHGGLTRVPEATIDFASVAFVGFAPDA